jgi:proteic killer suppression protein
MEVSFDNQRLQRLCNKEAKLRGKYGPRMAALVQQRLVELRDAENLDTLRPLPALRCHELTGNLAGLIAVRLVEPDRLVFRPDHDPLPMGEGGGLDGSRVTRIVVAGIGDYH